MNFGKAFTYVFEDPDWIKKILILALISLIPIVGQMVLLGWVIAIIKKMIHNEPVTLPEIDFGGLLNDGWKMFVITLIYALPSSILSGILNAVAAVGANANGDGSSEAAAGIVMVLSLCIGGLSFLYSIFLCFVLPIVYGRFAEYGTIGSGFQLGPIFSMIKKAIGPLFMTLIGTFVAGIVAMLGIIGCGVGILATGVYAWAAIAHFYGQVYNLAKAE
jgi:hypothetical protein